MKRKNYDPRAAIKNSKKHGTVEPADQAQILVENQEMPQQNSEYAHKNPQGIQIAEHSNHAGEMQLP